MRSDWFRWADFVHLKCIWWNDRDEEEASKHVRDHPEPGPEPSEQNPQNPRAKNQVLTFRTDPFRRFVNRSTSFNILLNKRLKIIWFELNVVAATIDPFNKFWSSCSAARFNSGFIQLVWVEMMVYKNRTRISWRSRRLWVCGGSGPVQARFWFCLGLTQRWSPTSWNDSNQFLFLASGIPFMFWRVFY